MGGDESTRVELLSGIRVHKEELVSAPGSPPRAHAGRSGGPRPEEGSRLHSAMLAPWSQTPSLQNCERYVSVVISHPAHGTVSAAGAETDAFLVSMGSWEIEVGRQQTPGNPVRWARRPGTCGPRWFISVGSREDTQPRERGRGTNRVSPVSQTLRGDPSLSGLSTPGHSSWIHVDLVIYHLRDPG